MSQKPKSVGRGLPMKWLGDPLPEEEAAMWAALSTPQRAKAIQRMTALDRWISSEGAIDAKQAAADAGVSLSRMYEMGKAWRERRSLTSLGAFAGAPKTRVGKHDAAIRKVLVSVVAADPEASVRKLALDLEAASGIPAGDLPSHNTFRKYVEEEKRRLQQRTKAGDDLMLDCSACTLTPTDSALLTLFVVLDRWTQVVLGAALGDVAHSRRGYALAAADALRRLQNGQFTCLPWVERMSRAELVVGLDADRWRTVKSEFAAAGIGAPIEPTKENRFGRYLRPLTGLRIGTVVVQPNHTVTRGGLPGLVRTVTPTADHVAKLAVEVDDHNAGRRSLFSAADDGSPPPDVTKMLKLLAGA